MVFVEVCSPNFQSGTCGCHGQLYCLVSRSHSDFTLAKAGEACGGWAPHGP